MSLAVDLVKEAGPYVLGLAGMYWTYRSGALQGREARHHARVEKLYLTMLDTLMERQREVFEGTTGDRRKPLELTSQVRLFASTAVWTEWVASLRRVGEAEVEWYAAVERREPGANRPLAHAHEVSFELLTAAMVADLEIPNRRSRTTRLRLRRMRRELLVE
ncbi:hypothetical protein FB561_7233 [Kribbella amoyensis]|uniref:Uncharacterized protein n=1 Tax=Kribbella amoyensis TaxID=996641 RepID=A0A561B3B1_9ACTN|nr:hypothetical protein [Kribbella amoyensis]TWD73344.1 hypothetical protein FB561_7233 [Kribbella amoyensis]